MFYFGSWHFVLDKNINLLTQFLSTGRLKKQDFIYEDNAILFRINEKYYGFTNDSHFFDSPFIQFMMLVFSILLFLKALELFLFGSSGD